MEEHKPVLINEVLHFLDVSPGRKYIDATVGGGGHTEAILKLGGEVLGIDQDPRSLEQTTRRLRASLVETNRGGAFKLALGNFSNILSIASHEGWTKVHGILFDLGFASFQVDDPIYGLSVNKQGPLDMRLDPSLGVTASDLVNSLSEKELARLFWQLGEEHYSKQIARKIQEERKKKRFQNTTELANLVADVYKRIARTRDRNSKIHPATKVFMSLRIAVNSEVENLKKGLEEAEKLLGRSGKLIAISFHSGEDKIIKNFFKEKEKEKTMRILTKKPVRPSQEEILNNPRSRSAKLRAGERI